MRKKKNIFEGKEMIETKESDEFDIDVESTDLNDSNEACPAKERVVKLDTSLCAAEPPVKATEVVEDKIITSVYSKTKFDDKDIEVCDKLRDDFSSFLTNTAKVSTEKDTMSTIPTGIDLLDTILGGGFGTKFNMIVGPAGGGKSALVSKVIATGQRKFKGKFISIYADSEESMTKERLSDLGIKYPEIEPVPHATVEKVFRIIEALCAYKAANPELLEVPSLVVWDSIANSHTEKGMEAEDVNSVLGEKARILSFLVPKYVSKLNKYNICLLAVNQLRDEIKMGMMHTPKDLRYLADGKNIPGGKAIIYNAFQLLYVRSTSDLKDAYGFSGHRVACKAVKNKLFAPNIDIPLVFSFSGGFSNFWTNFELLKDYKRLQASAWCKLESLPVDSSGNKISFRQNQAIDLYRNNIEFREAFDRDVEDILKVEYIEKYKSNNEKMEVWN